MAIVGKRSDPVRLTVRRIGMFLLLCLVVAAASAVWDVSKKEHDSRILREQAEAQLQELTLQKDQLSDEIARLKTTRGQEEALRSHYEVGRSGEKLLVIVEPPKAAPLATSTPFKTWVHTFLPFW